MDQLTIIKNGYVGFHDNLIPLMLQTEDPMLRQRVTPAINPIIWMAWHILRTEDMFLNTVIFDKKQVFEQADWKARLNIKTNYIGTGITPEEADLISISLDLDQLHNYNQAVRENSLKLIDSYPSLEIDQIADESELNRRLMVVDAFPEGVRQSRAKAYAPTPISAGILGILNHGYMHLGQYFSITKPL